jgi:hypothetical protein
MRLLATLATTLAMTLTAAVAVQARDKGQTVIVYVQNAANVPMDVKDRAEELASSMFVAIGVKINWRNGEPSTSSQSALAIKLSRNTPIAEKPGALAYAMPREGVHIVVFWDRMEVGLIPAEMLAHVMAHEIAHILEGVSRHSESGIMRAQWTEDDHKLMKTHPLSFADEDVDLIHRGLAGRAAR